MAPRKEKPMAYYEFVHNFRLGGPAGWELVNRERLQVGKIGSGLNNWEPWPDGYLVLPRGPWLFPHYEEVPRFLIDKKLGRPPRDVEKMGAYLLISKAVKDVIDTVAPGSCEFIQCETVTKSGEPARETWLCSATTVFLSAVDREASTGLSWSVGPGGKPAFSPRAGTDQDVKIHHEVIGLSHLFRLAEMASAFICDDVFKDACKQAGIKGALFLPFGH
ncbi:imm11 family protein [Rhizobium sp. PAMB 3174]